MNKKSEFPIFRRHPDLVYLDSAATSQKPQLVIDTVSDFLANCNSNVHRGFYDLAERATELYEGTRGKVADFIGAPDPAEIIFTGNASEALNLVALGFARRFLKSGDVVVTTQMEHHSNFVPWLKLQNECGIELVQLPINSEYRLDYQALLNDRITPGRIKLVTLTHASNVLGTVNPIHAIIHDFRQQGIQAKFVVDAAQSIPHLSIDVAGIGCDFLAFSSHKMLGPSGVGVLWGRRELLEAINPVWSGSHMVSSVASSQYEFAEVPARFEVGTGRLEGVVGLGAAVDYLQAVGMQELAEYERELTTYALSRLRTIPGLCLYGPAQGYDRLGVLSFNVTGIHPHDLADVLGQAGICVRAGHHCAQPLMRELGVVGTVRASLYLYNGLEDIERLVTGIEHARKLFGLA